MSTIPNRSKTALLVIDVQNAVVAQAVYRTAVIANISALVDRARQQHVPVIWVQQTGDGLDADTDGWQIVPELAPAAEEPVVRKLYGDAFEDTELESLLAELQVGHLVVTGAQTDACIRSTIHGAFTRGYDTTLVADGHTTEDLTEYGAPPPEQAIAYTNLYWQYHDGPGRKAAVSLSADVDFAAMETTI